MPTTIITSANPKASANADSDVRTSTYIYEYKFNKIQHVRSGQIIDLFNFRADILNALKDVKKGIYGQVRRPYRKDFKARLAKIKDALSITSTNSADLWDALDVAINETNKNWLISDWSSFSSAQPLVFAISAQLKLYPREHLSKFDLECEAAEEYKKLHERIAVLEKALDQGTEINTDLHKKMLSLETENANIKSELQEARDALIKNPDDFSAEYYTSHQAEILRLTTIIHQLEGKLINIVNASSSLIKVHEATKLELVKKQKELDKVHGEIKCIKQESEITKKILNLLIEHLKANGVLDIEDKLEAWQANATSSPDGSASASEEVPLSGDTPSSDAPSGAEENVSKGTFKKDLTKKTSSASVEIKSSKDMFFTRVPGPFENRESIKMTEKSSKKERKQHAGSINNDGSSETKKKRMAN